MRIILCALCFIVGVVSSAAALKWSDQEKAKKAIEAIQMANSLAAGMPQSITCRVNLQRVGGPSPVREKEPEVILDSGTAYTNLLAAITTKLNNDKATAEAYLSSVGVTND
jgi:formiminotetrahydrofolate cyclodeaminase